MGPRQSPPAPENQGRTRTQWTSRPDKLVISPEASSLNHLLRLWGTLSGLFGPKGDGKQPIGIDLSGLQEALKQAQQNMKEMRNRQSVLNTLKSSALAGAEALVNKYYGLQADRAPMSVVLENDMGNALAAVSYEYDRNGRMADEQLHISMSQMTPDSGPNGVNDHVIQNDRIIAHEMTHAIMGRNMDVRDLPDWFMEGTAEYIAGGAERVNIVLKHLSPQALLNRVLQPWEGDSSQYASAYLATRFLDTVTADNGGLKEVMARLKAGDSLDRAINTVSAGALPDTDSFLAYFARSGAGLDFMRQIDLSGKDPGSIKPGRGPDIVPDSGRPTSQPLKGFRITWPSPLEGVNLGFAPDFTPADTVVAAYQRQMDGMARLNR